MRDQLLPRSFPITGSDVSQGDLREQQTAPASLQLTDFEALYERHGKEIWAKAYARLLDKAAAEDITQDTFLRLLSTLSNSEPILNPRAWLMRVCGNLVEDYRKSASQRRRSQQFNPEDLDNIASPELSPLQIAAHLDLTEFLKTALAEIDITLRTPLMMHCIGGKTIDEISEEIGVARVTVWRRIDRALRQLRERCECRSRSAAP
ncbi:MAG TPA: sigma-70 family RNA polymerase sigma factor [Gemmataceae bacterium]|jgi:RNA polymerase sigma-70 factor (ECF subfamily)